MKRLFTFGCSMTRYAYGTWADLISGNFDEYYNYARSGSSNILSMNRFFEANSKHKFNKETDTVMIMMTGLGRHSYYRTKESWFTHGDLYSYLAVNKNPPIENFVKDIFDINCAIYQGWAAITSMVEFLKAKNIPYKIFMGVDFDQLKDVSDIETSDYIDSLVSLSENKVSFDKWFRTRAEQLIIHPATAYWFVEKRYDGHPNQRMHYEFVKTFLPEYDTKQTKDMFEYLEDNYDGTTQSMQEYTHNQLFHAKYNKAFQYPLFGQERGEI